MCTRRVATENGTMSPVFVTVV
ncbi:hypothetical protein BVI434_2120023 [Burkholderia vietnamiensis]|nr:hypothetical protein BVI434_2120023 [Burkholderia vietnamiensis]